MPQACPIRTRFTNSTAEGGWGQSCHFGGHFEGDRIGEILDDMVHDFPDAGVFGATFELAELHHRQGFLFCMFVETDQKTDEG